MLKKTNRMTAREFRAVWQQGKVWYRGETVVIKRVGGGKRPRLAVVVGKKTAKLAVVRNRLRRVVFARLAEVLLSQADSYIVIVNSVDENKLGRELEKAAKQMTGLKRQADIHDGKGGV